MITGNGRYLVLSADGHAGASVDAYREYLDPRYRDDFDAWRAKYRNPFRDLKDDGASRNWDSERRLRDLESDGVLGEVLFPNTVPPFFPSALHIAPPPSLADYEHRRAGIHAHNRWLAEFCADAPGRRAGCGQIFLNDIDDALEDLEWIVAHGLRGGVILPGVPDNAKHVKPLYDPSYDRLWAACQDHDLVLNHHSGGGSPDYGQTPIRWVLWLAETSFFSRRALTHLVMAGVFERFPRLRLALTELSVAWVPGVFDQLDSFHSMMRGGRVGEMSFPVEAILELPPSEYVRRNVWFGVSFPNAAEIETRSWIGDGKIMFGADFPHSEGTYPFTRECLRLAFSDVPPDVTSRMLSGNAADLYGFDLDALAPLAAELGPTVDEVARPLEAIPEGATSHAFKRT